MPEQTIDLALSQLTLPQDAPQFVEAVRLAAIDPVILAIQFQETLVKLAATEVDINRLALPVVPPPDEAIVDNSKPPKCFVLVQPLSELLDVQADTIALLCARLDAYQEQWFTKPFKFHGTETSQLRADADTFVPAFANNFPEQPSSEPQVAITKYSSMRSQPLKAETAHISQLLAHDDPILDPALGRTSGHSMYGDCSPQVRMKRYSFRRSAMLSTEAVRFPISLAPSTYATDKAGECRQQ